MGRLREVSSRLRLRLLGPFAVDTEASDTEASAPVPVGPVPVGKARRVLAVLAHRRGEFVPVDHLIDALWEDGPPDRADRNIAALVSRLRRSLGRDTIDGSAAGYRLPAARADVDLHEAIALVATAELELGHGRFALAATSGEMAAKLLDNDIAMAGEHEDRWVVELRDAVAALLLRARLAWSAAALELGSHDTAVQVASAVLPAAR
jgi:DNA-binding SARP family transcriptional activator